MSADAGEAESGPPRNVFGEVAADAVSLNLTALMDILSNLLFFLLASFGATLVMSVNATVPVQSADKTDVAKDHGSVTVTVRLSRAGLEIATLGNQGESELAAWKREIPSRDARPDYAAFADHLTRIKERYPASDTAILTVEPGIPYETMIGVMDAARERDLEAAGVRRPTRLFPTVVVSTVVK